MARLLVVDDEADICTLIVRRLVAQGHQVVSAHDAATALALVERHGMPDAAVLDVDLPGMDGVDLLAHLRRQAPALPALFLTVLWDGDVHARIRAAGAAYAAKPFTGAGLADAVRQILPGAEVMDP